MTPLFCGTITHKFLKYCLTTVTNVFHEPKVQRERRTKKNGGMLIECTESFAHIDKRNRSRHKCVSKKITEVLIGKEHPKDKFYKVITKLKNDEVGNGIRKNEMLIKLGRKYFKRFCHSMKVDECLKKQGRS